MAEEKIEVADNPATSRIEAHIGDQTAYAAYELSPGTIKFTHTLVPEALRHRGIATQLVEAGIDLARRRGLAIVPHCPFFQAYFAAHPELSALVAAPPKTPG